MPAGVPGRRPSSRNARPSSGPRRQVLSHPAGQCGSGTASGAAPSAERMAAREERGSERPARARSPERGGRGERERRRQARHLGHPEGTPGAQGHSKSRSSAFGNLRPPQGLPPLRLPAEARSLAFAPAVLPPVHYPSLPPFRAHFRFLATPSFPDRFRPSNLVPPRPLLGRFYSSDGLRSLMDSEKEKREAREPASSSGERLRYSSDGAKMQKRSERRQRGEDWRRATRGSMSPNAQRDSPQRGQWWRRQTQDRNSLRFRRGRRVRSQVHPVEQTYPGSNPLRIGRGQ
jgi:hypothetical protein